MQGIIVELSELIHLSASAKTLNLSKNRRVKSDRYGGYLSSLKGRGIDFEETRTYQVGDDPRMMDWRVTARTGKAHTKIFKEERERPVFILGDFSQSMFFGTKVAFKSHIASKIAATLAWVANLQGDRIGGIFFNEDKHTELKPRARKAGIFPILNTLSDYSKPIISTGNFSLESALLRLRRVVKPGSLVFVIGDFQQLNKLAMNHLMMLSKHAQVIAIQLYDLLEREPPQPNQYHITNGIELCLLNTKDKAFCQKYKDNANARQRFIHEVFKQCQIPLLEISTSDDWFNKLIKFSRKVKL